MRVFLGKLRVEWRFGLAFCLVRSCRRRVCSRSLVRRVGFFVVGWRVWGLLMGWFGCLWVFLCCG